MANWLLTVLMLVFFAASVSAQQNVYVGVFREGAPRNMNFIRQFEKQAGKKPAMVMWYQDWTQDFPLQDARNVVDYGAVCHVVWEPWLWSDNGKIKLDNIIKGEWDKYIEKWAADAKAFKETIYLRWGHEFNIEKYPWGILNNEKDPDKYIKAWKRVHAIFKKVGADNVKWIWCFNNYPNPDESWNDWELAYPGDEYVDWIGIDGYNWGTTQSWSGWQSFKEMLRDQVRRVSKKHPGKPLMIAEFASTEQGGDKAKWIKEIPGYLKSSMRAVNAIVWFDVKKESDWRITSSEKSLAAFKAIMKEPLFSGSAEGMADFVLSPKISPAGDKKTAYAASVSCPVKIDGRLGEWNRAFGVVMKDKSFFKEGLIWNGPSDLSGKIYLMWDKENLYIAAEVMDKIPLVNKKSRQDIWNGDGLEMVLSVDPGADPKRESFERGDYQFGFSAGDGKGNKPAIWNWQRRRTPINSEIFVKRVDKSLGYVIEAKVPWSFFTNGFVPSAGTKIGFDVAIDDADSTGEREKQFIWNGDFYFYKDPGVWGILEFK